MDNPIRVLVGRKMATAQATLINAQDAHLLASHHCYPHTSSNTIYIRCYVPHTADEPRKYVFLHALILQPPPGMVSDHINGNGLDNRRSNLRSVDRKGNCQNQGKKQWRDGSLMTSKYMGVSRRADSGAYQAHLRVNGNTIHLGQFTIEKDAARARDDAVKRYGLLSKLNFPKRCPNPPAPAATPRPVESD